MYIDKELQTMTPALHPRRTYQLIHRSFKRTGTAFIQGVRVGDAK